MFCSQCGKQVDLSSRFCPACGTTISAPPPPPSGYHPNSGRLTRPLTGGVIGGVCAGIAAHYGWDLTLVRVIWVLCVLFAGTGILAYVAAWIIIPQEPYPISTKSI